MSTGRNERAANSGKHGPLGCERVTAIRREPDRVEVGWPFRWAEQPNVRFVDRHPGISRRRPESRPRIASDRRPLKPLQRCRIGEAAAEGISDYAVQRDLPAHPAVPRHVQAATGNVGVTDARRRELDPRLDSLRWERRESDPNEVRTRIGRPDERVALPEDPDVARSDGCRGLRTEARLGTPARRRPRPQPVRTATRASPRRARRIGRRVLRPSSRYSSSPPGSSSGRRRTPPAPRAARSPSRA